MWWPLQWGPRTQLVADCTHGRGHLDWKRGEVVPRTKVAITLETKPGNKPGTNKLESRLGTGARPQGTATCRPHASISKLAHLGGLGGGWGAGVLVGCTGQRSAAEHKSLRSLVRKPVARLRPKNHFATLPII